jgi:hypothetical protein
VCQNILKGEQFVLGWVDDVDSFREDVLHITLSCRKARIINRQAQLNKRRTLPRDQWTRIHAKWTKFVNGVLRMGPRTYSITLWVGAPIRCYHTNKSYRIMNGQNFVVEGWDDNVINLAETAGLGEREAVEDGVRIAMRREDFSNVLESSIAITCHKTQGQTIANRYIYIWDVYHYFADIRWMYTAVSRARDWEKVKLVNESNDSRMYCHMEKTIFDK